MTPDVVSNNGYLHTLKLKGFKSIQSMDLNLKMLNILIGPNGAGKSNFVQFFKFMNEILEKRLHLFVELQTGADNIIHFGQKTTSQIEIELYFPPNGYNCILVPTTDDRLIFKSETAYFYGDTIGYLGGDKARPLAKPGDRESALPFMGKGSPSEWVATYLNDWKVYHFHDTSESAKVKKTCLLDDSDRLAPDAGNLAAFLYNIKDTEEYKQIVCTVKRVAPFFQDFYLQPESNKQDSIKLRWKHSGNSQIFGANQFSDGTIRFICLATLFLQPNRFLPRTIIVDEPELGLHPHAIYLLSGLIKSCSARTQVIAATQSVTLLNQFTWEDVIVVDREENHSAFRRLQEKEDSTSTWMEEYGLGELWERNWLGGTP